MSNVQCEGVSVSATAVCVCVCMQVYDGSSDSAPQLARLCGSQQPSPVNSTGNQLYVKLRTDSSVATGGFLASYSTSKAKLPKEWKRLHVTHCQANAVTLAPG